VCLSTVTHGRALADTVAVLRVLKAAAPDLLFSGLIAPHMVGESELAALRNAGMDRIAIGLDAAFERGFEHRRGRRVLGSASWEQYWGVLRKARMMFGPFHVSCHVNVGLGESDVDVVETLFRLRHAEIAVFPVSVYSDAGTERPGSCRPGLARRQRLQLARQLIAMDVLAPDQVVYSAAGCIERFVVSPGAIEAAARVDGLGCSRLFGSYRPISQEDFSPVDAAENRAENLQSTPTPTAVKPRRAAKYGQAQREGQSGNEGRAFAEVVR
jgi:biotin synthase